MRNHIEGIRMRAEEYVSRNEYASVEWHFEKGGVVLSEGSVGFADPIAGKKLPEVPIYRIYSMTKPIVAAAAILLIEEGKLTLSEPVAQYIPEFSNPLVVESDGSIRAAASPLLIEHLFTHTSGISYHWQQDNAAAKNYLEKVKFQDQYGLADFVTSLAEQPLFADPGTVWHYSYSLDVLGHILSIIEGKSLGDVLNDRIFEPLGTKDTGFFVPAAERNRILPMFTDPQNVPGVPVAITEGPGVLDYAAPAMLYPSDDPNYARGGTGLFSTLIDYAKLSRFLISGLDSQGSRILSEKGVESLWTNRLPESDARISIGGLPKYLGYGFGLGGRVLVRPQESPFYSVKGEAGWEGAGNTYFWVDPDNDITGVVLTQYLGQKFPLGEELRAMLYQSHI